MAIDTERLAAMVRAKRGKKGLRAVAKEIGGVSASTLSRVEQGRIPDLETFVRLCQWLDIPYDDLVESGKSSKPAVELSLPDQIAIHLRADRTLDRDVAEALVRMIQLAYQAATRGDLNNYRVE